MKTNLWILSAICIVCFFFHNGFPSLASGNSTVTYYTDAQKIIGEVTERGAGSVVNDLFDQPKAWDYVLKNIAKGTEVWLKVAVALHPGSDAAPSEMLNIAVGEALENAPENVFRIALPDFRLNSICSGPDVDDARYNSYELSMKATKLRQDRISSISAPDLKDVGRKCIQLLEESKAWTAKFYGIHDKTH